MNQVLVNPQRNYNIYVYIIYIYIPTISHKASSTRSLQRTGAAILAMGGFIGTTETMEMMLVLDLSEKSWSDFVSWDDFPFRTVSGKS
jgi:hypothetical protein